MNVRQLTKMSICVALLCVSAYISFPVPMAPAMVTAQTVVVNLIALILGPAQSAITVGVYILLGIIGVPVFSGGNAGIGVILGPTGGFIWGFILAAPLMSFLKGNKNSLRRFLLVTICAGMPVIYLFGSLQLTLLNHIGFLKALSAAVLPYIVGDVLKSIAAASLAVALNKALASQRMSI